MFIRTNARPFGRSLGPITARALTVAVYGGYLSGCALQLLAGDAPGRAGLALAGLGLVIVAVAAFCVLATSSLQRLAQEPASQLDERELQERNRAAFIAHSLFSGVVLSGLFYMMVRADLAANGKAQLWAPVDGDQWSALMLGMAMFSLTLPAAVLAWTRKSPEGDET
jgi:hypothetical protein